MITFTHPAVAEYVGRIEAALADLPTTEVEEIVEDIGQHLSEVAGELGAEVSVEALSARLGTPEQYASELRAAAGYPPATAVRPTRGRRFLARVALYSEVLAVATLFLTGLASTPRMGKSPLGTIVIFGPLLVLALILAFTGRNRMAVITDLPEYRALSRLGSRMVGSLSPRIAAYLLSLRPAWWLVRIAVLVFALLVAGRPNIDDGYSILPTLALVVLLWFGRRARINRRWAWVITPANAFAIGLGLALLIVALTFTGRG